MNENYINIYLYNPNKIKLFSNEEDEKILIINVGKWTVYLLLNLTLFF